MKSAHHSNLRKLIGTFTLTSLLALPAQAQITANDDGSAGGPFETTGEEAAITAGSSVTANDTGTLEVLTLSTTSANGAAVEIEDSSGTIGQFSYDPRFAPLLQALPLGGFLIDTFDYTIGDQATPTSGITSELNPSSGLNNVVWANLPGTAAPGAGAPSSFSSVYDYSGTTAVSTRAAFTASGWNTQPVSLEFWVKQDTLQDVCLWETGGSGIGSGVFLDDTGTVKWAIKTQAARELLDSTVAMTAGTWHHIVITVDTSTGTSIIYLDGANVGTVTNAGNNNWSGGNGAGLGGSNSDAGGDNNNNTGANAGTSILNEWRNPFNGQIGLFRFYANKVLTPAEVVSNQNSASALTDTATVSLRVDGANDAPRGTADLFSSPLVPQNAVVNFTRGLTENDGVPGSSLQNILTADLPGLTVSQSPSAGTPPGGGVPERAFDQNPQRYTHTDPNNTVDHTWTADFGTDVTVGNVTIFNRADCCGERLRDITISVQDSSGTTIASSPALNVANALGFTGASGGTLEHDFGGITGRSITVTRTPDLGDADVSNGSVLSLGEVTVRGSISNSSGNALFLNYDARYGATDDLWPTVGSSKNARANWALGSGVTLNSSVTSARSQITAALEWDGTVNAEATYPGTSISSIFGASVDQAGATLEAWLKLGAADLSQISTIFETGGGTGFGLVIDNGVLKAACELDGFAGNQSAVSYDLQADPLNVLGGLATTAEFFQVASVIRPQGGVSLYVNGILVGETTSGNNADWDGGDASGLGHYQGTNHGGFINTAATASGGIYNTHFNGSMAVFRIYNAALEPTDVYEAFKAVDGSTDIDGDTISVDGVVDSSGSVVTLGVPATLASGAIVTINNAAGEFSYDPNGQFNFLAIGQTATDTFTYRIDDGNGAKGFAEASVTMTGLSDAVDDNFAMIGNQAITFSDNALTGNDQPLPPASGAYIDYSPATLSSPTWVNAGTAGFNVTTGSNVTSGLNINTGFGFVGSALDTGGGTSSTLDPISQADATFEIWFRPEPGQTGKYTVFETGGNGNGFSIVYDADAESLTATVDAGTDRVIGGDQNQTIQATATGVLTSEFNQLIVVYDRDGGPVGFETEDNLTLYLNNDPNAAFDPTVDGTGVNTNGTANDWCGTDGSGYLSVSGTAALNENFPGAVGLLASVRVYGRILTTTEMDQSFEAGKREVTAINTSSALGASVTDNGDGTFTYDPTSLPALAAGETLADSFTYTTTNGTGGSTTATVTFVLFGDNPGPNQQPTGNLSSLVVYASPSTGVSIVPTISADDPDAALLGDIVIPVSATTSASAVTITDPGPGGCNLRVNFTLAASDVVGGARRVVGEIGGTSNGLGVYLIDGIPYFIAKMNSVASNEPAGTALDNDWETDGLVLVPLAGGTLSSGTPQTLSLSFTGDSVTWDLNGGGSTTQALVNLSNRTNWSGDDTLGFGQRSNGNGGTSDTAGAFQNGTFLPLDGSIQVGGFGTYPAEIITATLTIPVLEGSFTAPAGSTYFDNGVDGTWTATGPVNVIRQLLLDVDFIPNGVTPATATVSVGDGGEDGSVAVTGTLTFTEASDTDSLDTLLEYAFGTDPNANDDGPLALDGSVNGTPIINTDFSGPGVEFSGVFVRRDDHGSSGSVTYIPEFSADLVTWEASTDIPAFVADSTDNPDYEVVSVAYPFFVSDGRKARFFRVRVILVP